MTTDKFWELIDAVHAAASDDMDEKCELISEKIKSLSPEEASAFSEHFDDAMDEAYSWALWGAAYIIHGGCSDDSFMDFRASLISRGRAAFEAAIADPDSMAEEEFDEQLWFFEGYQYAVMEGVESVMGDLPERAHAHPADPSGEEWDEEDLESLVALYPKLSARFE